MGWENDTMKEEGSLFKPAMTPEIMGEVLARGPLEKPD
jgi:hypothetical protein